jgi:hypothetical protein
LNPGKPGPFLRNRASWIQGQMSFLERDADVQRVIGKTTKKAKAKKGTKKKEAEK